MATFFKPQLSAQTLYVKNDGVIEFETGTGTLTLQGGEPNGDYSITLPNTAGTIGQYLKSFGGGITIWDNPPSGSVGGNANEIQINDGAGGFAGNSNFTIDENLMYIGNTSASSRLVFTGGNPEIGTASIRSNSPNYLRIHTTGTLNIDGDTSFYLGGNEIYVNASSSVQMNAGLSMQFNSTGIINMTSGHTGTGALLIATSGLGGTIELSAIDTLTLGSEDTTSNESVRIKSTNGGIKLESKRLFLKTNDIAVGDGETHIYNTSGPGTSYEPTASVLYFYVPIGTTVADYYWDATGYGVDGQVIKILYDNSEAPTVGFHAYFGSNGLVSGSGLATSLYFNSLGQSSELICKLMYGDVRRWMILNTGAAVYT